MTRKEKIKLRDISSAAFRVMRADEIKSKLPTSVETHNRYVLLIDGEPLATPKGNMFLHTEEKLLQQILRELDVQEYLDTTNISSYSLFCTEKDFIESQKN